MTNLPDDKLKKQETNTNQEQKKKRLEQNKRIERILEQRKKRLESEINFYFLRIPKPSKVIKAVDPLSAARQRGQEYRKRSISNSLNELEVMSQLKLSSEELFRLRHSDRLIALNINDSYVYPKCQFSEARIVDGIDLIIQELPVKDAWTQLIFLESGDASLDGDRPIDRLRQGDIASVVAAAGNYGRQRPV